MDLGLNLKKIKNPFTVNKAGFCLQNTFAFTSFFPLF